MKKIRIVSLLTPREALLADRIDGVLRATKYRGRIIHKTQPSAFIKPHWLDRSSELKRALFEGIILFSVVKGYKNSTLVAAVVDRTSEHSGEVLNLLQQFDIPAITVDDNADVASLEKKLTRTLIDSVRPSSTKPITNPYENWLLAKCSLGLRHKVSDSILRKFPQYRGLLVELMNDMRRRYQIFHEVALTSFLSLADIQRDSDSAIRLFAKASRVDALITGPAPEYLPLIVIEFDGNRHLDPGGLEKDRKKEHILARANIPLIRVSIKDAPDDIASKRVIDLGTKKENLLREKILEQLIIRCAHDRERSAINNPKQWASYLAKFKRLLEVKIRQKKLSESRLYLGNKERADLFEEVEEDLFEDWLNIATDEKLEREYRKESLDPNSERYPSISAKGAEVRDLEYIQNPEVGITCRATVRWNGKNWRVSTPSVRFSGTGLSSIKFDDVLKEELAISILNRTDDWLSKQDS